MTTHSEPSDLDILLDSGHEDEIRSFLRLLQRDELIELLQELSTPHRAKIFSYLHPSDLADFLTQLPEVEWNAVLEELDHEALSDLLSELEDPEIQRLLQMIQHQELPAILSDMESDDAADILGELSEQQALAILKQMPDEESDPIEKLLQYPEDSAGGLMQTELIAVPTTYSVSETIEAIRMLAEKDDDLDIYEIFVIDERHRLEGQISLKTLILADPTSTLGGLLDAEHYWVHPELDQEEVADYFQKYDLISLPVVDKGHHLLGRITVDDVVNVIEEEASEDILQLAGANKQDLVYDKILRSVMLRIPWLFTNLGGGLLTGYLMWLYKATLSEILALITFVPVITGMGGNVGTQSSSITVRGFAINRIDLSNFGRYLFKEMRVGALLGVLCGGSLMLIGYLWHGNPMLGVVVGSSLFMAMTLAAITGSLFPAFFTRIKIDPALASGPFVTTINDVTGILIYLTTATIFRQWLLH
ncbi:MAG: magnesium transporter [Deltaproteobacteria bacterium]|nr:magnesium transporter [Deltaproteobacteria bacterium]|tara:strand:+ start:29 stop:1456 length:1428 start_codon:yes stop_codon:yes gene_type:complete